MRLRTRRGGPTIKQPDENSLKVTFQPSGRRGTATSGEDLLTIARRAGVKIESACGGKGSCGKCRVRLDRADANPLSPVTDSESRLLTADLLDAGTRLACQARVQAAVSVFVPEESRRASTVGGKEAREREREVDPAVRALVVSLPVSEPQQPPEEPAVRAALEQQHGLTGVEIEPEALAALRDLVETQPDAKTGAHPDTTGRVDKDLAAIMWQGTVPGRAADRASDDTEPPSHPQPPAARASALGPATVLDFWSVTNPRRTLGLALDIGTTTIAAYLADLATGEVLDSRSALNPQVSFGGDIISRMQYAAHHVEGATELQSLVVAEVNKLAKQVTKRTRTNSEDILDVVMVGNTAMHHLFLGIDTAPLRGAPFEPAVSSATNTRASAVGLYFHPACRLYALPNEAGFVGADNVAVIISEEPYKQDEVVLLIDVGTNGELVLGNRERLLSASCATGPAFEGAHIEHGMRAAPGAIERIRIDPETLEVRFKVIGKDAWSTDMPPEKVKARGICGSGMIEAAAEMFKAGVILPDGGFNPDLSHERVLKEKGRPRRLVIAREQESATGRAITVSLKDIRAMQLGKSALRAGAEILLDHYGIEKPDHVALAGAFGSYIDKHAALAIGMLPPCDPEKVNSVGNAAGDGALLALLALGKRQEAEWVAETVDYVELASVPDFQEHYVAAMRFEASNPGS